MVQVEIADEVTDFLVGAPCDQDDRQAVGKALSDLIAQIVRERL